MRGGGLHRSEFADREGLEISAEASLTENGGSLRVASDPDGDQKHREREKEEEQSGKNEIGGSLSVIEAVPLLGGAGEGRTPHGGDGNGFLHGTSFRIGRCLLKSKTAKIKQTEDNTIDGL